MKESINVDVARPFASSGPPIAMPVGPPDLTFGPFRVDQIRRRLYRGDEVLSIPMKAMETLLVLIEQRGEVVEKRELMERVWPGTYVGEDSLAQSVCVLRHALGDDVAHPEFILTVPRRGYRFIAPIAEMPDEETPAMATPQAEPEAPRSSFPRVQHAMIAALVLGMVATSGAVFVGRSSKLAPAPVQFRETPPRGWMLSGEVSASPDGRCLAYVATSQSGGASKLWVRRLDVMTAEPLDGTDGATLPFWSPDSGALGFFAGRWLKTINLSSRIVQPLAQVLLIPTGATWSSTGWILFGTRTSALHLVPASGGRVTPATTLDRSKQEYGHARPEFLSDGRRFVFESISSNPAHSGTYVGDLESGERVRLLDGSHHVATLAPNGHLLSITNGRLVAHAFDSASLKLSGFVPITDTALPWNPLDTTISASDTLIALGGRSAHQQLRWYDRTGRPLGIVDTATPLHTPALSADATQLVASSDPPDLPGVWLVDLVRGGSTRIASDGIVPYWSTTGDRIAYASSRRAGVLDIYVKSVWSKESDVLLFENEWSKGVTDWSRDGRRIVLSMANPQSNIDIWILEAESGRATPWLQTTANEVQGRLSPDGRWMAYASDETGRWEVYLQPVDSQGVKRAVSVAGGAQPSWRADSRELYFLTLDGDVCAVEIFADSGRPGPPVVLFRAPVSNDLVRRRNLYAATGDGQRFLIDTQVDIDSGITSILDWQPALGSP